MVRGWPWVPEEGLGQAWGPCGQLLPVSRYLRDPEKPGCAVEGRWDVLRQLATNSLNEQAQFKAN